MSSSPPGFPVDGSDAPLAALSRLAVAEHAGHDPRHALEQVVRVARETLPGAASVSVTLLRGTRPSSPAASDGLALRCDERQYDVGDGPCLEAARQSHIVSVPDLTDEERWPAYSAYAQQEGVRSSLSIPIAPQQSILGALNVYFTQPRALAPDAVVLAHAFAAHAAVAVASTVVRQMEEAMETRAVIEQAKGILMTQRHCDPDEAFRVLVRASTRNNRKLREIAGEIVEAVQATSG